MQHSFKRLFALLLTLVMVVCLIPTAAFAASPSETDAAEAVYVYTEADTEALNNDVFARIENVKAEAAEACGGIGRMTEQDYVDLVPQVIAAVESSETYVPGTLQQNGSFLVWETTVGLPCCYSPRMEAQLHNTENDPTEEEIAKAEEQAAAIFAAASTRGGGPTAMDIGLIQPFWESTSSYADSSFNNYSPSYKAMWQSLAETTGGSAIRYSMSNATIDNIAATMSQCGVVIFDSHGDTDYASGSDYTSRANTSYLCLTATTGFTSVDTAAQTGPYGTYYNAMVSSGYGFINGTAIANHMPNPAPNSLLYMGICLGMATDGMHAGLRANGVEVVHGYSQSVTFVGEEIYMSSILGYVKDGMTYSDAITQTKNETCWWDPHPNYTGYTEAQAASNRIAFPIVVSSEDTYPGHGNVDAIQNVYSTWSLFGDACEVTAVSNNPDWGTVSVTGYSITATPAEGYFAQGYTVLNGTAAVTQNGNVFRVQPETDCTVQINFAAKTPTTVTYMAGSTVVGTQNTYLGDDVNLLTESTEFADWTFLGWMDQPLGTTMEKPVFYKPGAVYTVTAANPILYALYKHIDGDGSVAYELVEPSKGALDGTYVITSGKTDAMYVMTGVNGSSNIESNSQGYTAFANTGIELEDNALRNVEDAYLFTVEEQDGGYSVQSVTEGSFLAVYNSYLWVRESYESACCNWTITPTASGVTLMCTASTSYPYLNWSGSKWAASSSSSSLVQLWKGVPSGDVYYSTAPVVEEHDHEMVYSAELAPTCGANGHTAYYQCSICFKYFSDAAGENEITLASTVIPATGNHTYGAWISNDNGTHDHVCTVCGATETESCVYESVVTAPTPTEGGYTTYTCTVCGYTYVGNYTSPTGYDFTIVFSVPLECEQPNDMICNNLTGVTLPTLTAPEGYSFLGWVEQPYDNVSVRPAEILTGHYTTNADVTLYALFKYVVSEGGGETVFELLTEEPADWTGNYVITYDNTESLYAMKGLDAGLSYETSSNGGQTAYEDTGMTLDVDTLSDVDDAYIFEVAPSTSGSYTIQNAATGTYLGVQSSTLYAIDGYTASASDYTLTLMSGGNVSAYLTAGGSWAYLAFSSYSNKFWTYSSTEDIYFWKETNAGTPYWTTIIGEPDPGVDYTITFTTPNGVTDPAPMTVNNMTGAILPTVTAPEGYTFLGWVLEDYDNVDVKPEGILSGRYRPQSDITLKALFKYKVLDGSTVAYELVTEQLTDWTGNYVITCNKDEATMIVMHGVGADMTYEHRDSYGMYELADSGLTLEDNFLYDAGPNYVFAIEAQDEGYSIQNLGSENFVGRYCTSSSQSAQLYSFSAYDPTFCRWTFEYGNPGDTDVVDNVLIANVMDPDLDQYYQYLGCGWYYHFTGESENYPYFWVDGTGDPADSDVFYMYLWKETAGGTNYWTTVIEDLPTENLVDVYFVDQDDNATPYVYAFGPNSAQNAAFPGVPVTALGTDENGDNYYKVTLDRSVYTNVIFSGGSNTTQTADLELGTGERIIYYVNNHTGYVGADIWPDPPVVVEPTCTEPGSITYTGMFTGATHLTETGSLGHLPGDPVQENYVEPTATTDGGYDTVVYCQRCSAELSREHTVLPATGLEEPVLDPNISIFSSLSLGIEITASISVRVAQMNACDHWYVQVDKLDADGSVLETQRFGEGQEYSVVAGNVMYEAQFTGISAKEMGVSFEASVHCFDAAGNETYNYVERTSFREYIINELLNTGNADKTRTLCADMLNYAAAAQVFFGYDVEHLVNADLSAEAAAAMEQFATTEEPAADLNNTNSTNMECSVSVMNRVVVSIVGRRLNAGDAVVTFEVKDSEGNVRAVLDTVKHGSAYVADYAELDAADMREPFTFTALVNGVATGEPAIWSLEGYVKEARAVDLSTLDPETQLTRQKELALLNALLVYVDSVKNLSDN